MDAIRNATDYLARLEPRTPLFVAFDAADDLHALQNALASCKTMRTSDYCTSPDVLPDLDALVNRLATNGGKVLLLGVGEYAALTGDVGFVRRIFGMENLMTKVVVPIWKGHAFLRTTIKGDPRVLGRRSTEFPETGKHWTVKVFEEGLVANPDAQGFQNLLKRLEDGCEYSVNAVTSVVPLDTDWCRRITSAYDAYHERNPQSTVPKAMFTEQEWSMFLNVDRTKSQEITSADVLLHLQENGVDDPYLAFVLSKTERYSDWKHNLLCSILDVGVEDSRFEKFYGSRKKLLENFSVEDILIFIRESMVIANPMIRLRYLTDVTLAERVEILKVISEIGDVPYRALGVWPALRDYVRPFHFSADGLGDVLTKYVQDYKREKILNRVSPAFSDVVADLAEDRPQFVLQTREAVLEGLVASKPTLCWIDALGCEFLGFVQAEAERFGLKIKVTPTRARLPSITSVNRGFYDNWTGNKMPPVMNLDKIKHGNFDRLGSGDGSVAEHLPHELDVLGETIQKIASLLRRHDVSKVVLTSDHGATRLAVISGKETVWEMPEKGKHGGRCCKKSEFDGELPRCVTESDDERWHVLAGYDRFSGGRKGDVEVHGGATLEEMVVPVVELELLDRNLHIQLTKNEFNVTFRDAELVLPIFCSAPLSSPTVEITGKRFAILPVTGVKGHWEARIPMPTAGHHEADVFDGDTKVGSIAFNVTSGGAKINKVDDFFGKDF